MTRPLHLDDVAHLPARVGAAAADASKTLVHPAEAIAHLIPCPDDGANRRLALAARKAHLPRVADRLEQCARGWWAWDDRPGMHAPLLDPTTNLPIALLASCHHRLCPRCAAARARKLGRRLDALVAAEFEGPAMFITLTRESLPGESPAVAAAALLDAFTRLRRARVWSQAVRGGFAATHFEGPDGRHVHLHAVVDADWIGQDDLLAAWRRRLARCGSRTLGANGGVHLRRADSDENVTFYTLKAQLAEGVEDHDLPELMAWMHRRRLLQVFGSLRGKKVAEPKPVLAAVPASRREGSQRAGINAATGDWVPVARISWQSSELAHRIGYGVARGGQGATVRRSTALPDEVDGEPTRTHTQEVAR
jgi:hypothetical protein